MLLKLIGAIAFGLGGIYHIRQAQKIADLFYDATRNLRAPLAYVFPARVYKSRAFLWTLRIGGAICLLISGMLFLSILKNSP